MRVTDSDPRTGHGLLSPSRRDALLAIVLSALLSGLKHARLSLDARLSIQSPAATQPGRAAQVARPELPVVGVHGHGGPRRRAGDMTTLYEHDAADRPPGTLE
jgi:hypothetical protein